MKQAALVLLTVVGLVIVSGCCEPDRDTRCYPQPVARCVVPAEVTAEPPPPPPCPPCPPCPQPAPPPPATYCDPCASFGVPVDDPVRLGGELIHLQPVDGTGIAVAKR